MLLMFCSKHVKRDIHYARKKVGGRQVCVLHVLSGYQILHIFFEELSTHSFHDFCRNNLNVRLFN